MKKPFTIGEHGREEIRPARNEFSVSSACSMMPVYLAYGTEPVLGQMGFVRCEYCRRVQSVTNETCAGCGAPL